jgi:hypothetical protein
MDKSYVTMEQKKCLVCGVDYDTGSILMNKRLKKQFQAKTVTGMGLCDEHEKLHADGYIALVAADPKKSLGMSNQKSVRSEDAYRTGQMAHMRREVASKLFKIGDENLAAPMIFVEPEVLEDLKARMPKPDKDS